MCSVQHAPSLPCMLPTLPKRSDVHLPPCWCVLHTWMNMPMHGNEMVHASEHRENTQKGGEKAHKHACSNTHNRSAVSRTTCCLYQAIGWLQCEHLLSLCLFEFESSPSVLLALSLSFHPSPMESSSDMLSDCDSELRFEFLVLCLP